MLLDSLFNVHCIFDPLDSIFVQKHVLSRLASALASATAKYWATPNHACLIDKLFVVDNILVQENLLDILLC